MAKAVFPDETDLRIFIRFLRERNTTITRYLPSIDEEWYRIVIDCINYVRDTSHYEECTVIECAARILYKIAKRHELGDGNKRSSLMGVYLFCLLNDYYILDPAAIKEQAKRIAKTKGRSNEELIRKRVAEKLKEVIEYIAKKT